MTRFAIPFLTSLALGSTTLAGGGIIPDDFDDIFVGFDSGRVTTSRIIDDGAGGFLTEPSRVFSAEFGESGLPGFADDPGYFSFGVFAEGTAIGFNILDAARAWNGTDFNAISSSSVTLAFASGVPGSPEVTTPGVADQFVAGFEFVSAEPLGLFDQHIDLTLNDPAPGVYLLKLELFVGDGRGATNSLPYWIVLGNDADPADLDAAIAYTEQVIVPTPGALAPAALIAVAAFRRRR